MSHQLPLSARLSLWMTAIAMAGALGMICLQLWSSDRYHQEVTQQLHAGLAQYVLDHQPAGLLDSAGRVNKEALKSLAMNTMMINPAVEIYLLDRDGVILGHALPDIEVPPGQVDIAPIRQLLEGDSRGPILGDNPRSQDPVIFSAAPVLAPGSPANHDQADGALYGYLYAVLASHKAVTLAEQLASSHVLRMSLVATLALLLFLGLGSAISFRLVASPLRELISRVRNYRLTQFSDTSDTTAIAGNEVRELEHSFELMQGRIQQQFDELTRNDQLRRELISNVSHDLRTPLASMQGYLETLLLKNRQLTETDLQRYLNVAYRHSQRLTRLVSQLFELSRLDAGRVAPQMEVFSLTELLFDLRQEYELTANRQGVTIELQPDQSNILVRADIALIQRVLQNLLDNALRHTPAGGSILISLRCQTGQVEISLQDDGAGIDKRDLPYVFDRFYQSGPQSDDSDAQTTASGAAGLGLSIVKRILDLHGSAVKVTSQLHQGTCFTFGLPTAS